MIVIPANHPPSPKCNRREFLTTGVVAAIALTTSGETSHADESKNKSEGLTFSFGTYGMKTLKTEEAIRVIAETGYDGVELAARPDWDSAPARMPAKRRGAVRRQLDDANVRVTALMEHLIPAVKDEEHRAGLDRLCRVAELGRDLSPSRQPLIQTVLGGGRWNEVRTRLRDRLADWAKVAAEMKTVIAIKPHRGGAMSRPAEAVWLIRQLDDTPWIRMVYDYSHYAFRDMPLADTIRTALPYTAHIAIKDTVKKSGGGFQFVLPGASGTFDYVELLKRFYTGGYRGDICCEVSGMVWSQPGYDPHATAKTCYANIAPMFDKAGVRRG